MTSFYMLVPRSMWLGGQLVAVREISAFKSMESETEVLRVVKRKGPHYDFSGESPFGILKGPICVCVYPPIFMCIHIPPQYLDLRGLEAGA